MSQTRQKPLKTLICQSLCCLSSLFEINNYLSWAALNADLSLYFSCVLGFFGEPLTPGGNCSRCRCNNNSDVCNRTTGECIDCQHNTTGFYCERCENGTWGNATEQQCQGSLPVNSHTVTQGIVNYQYFLIREFQSILKWLKSN